jgi:hypothetical protein
MDAPADQVVIRARDLVVGFGEQTVLDLKSELTSAPTSSSG